MLLVYDTDNVLHITNDKGLRWNYDKTQKPQFGFEYDTLFFNPYEDERIFILNDEEHSLSDESIQAEAHHCISPLNRIPESIQSASHHWVSSLNPFNLHLTTGYHH